MVQPIDPAAFRAAMARFAASVSIVTACEGSERRGITATAVTSVSAEPPSLLVCLNRKTGTCAAAMASGRFVVNLLPQGAQELALGFAGAGGASGEAKFAHGSWTRDDFGLPVLQEALISLSCRVQESLTFGTHQVLIGRIEALHGLPLAQDRALIHEQSRFHRLTAI